MTTYGKYIKLAFKRCGGEPITGLTKHEAWQIYQAARRLKFPCEVTRTGDRIDKKYSVKVFAINI